MSFSTALAAVLLSTALKFTVAQSLNVVNRCSEDVFIFTQTSYGSIDNNIIIPPGSSQNLGISSNWDGAVNVGTNCDSSGLTCDTGGPTWDGTTPFSRAEFNFWAIPGSVTYDISMIYGFNVGMMISTSDPSCDQFSCDGLANGCPVPGPDNSCYSGCCTSAQDCSGGALPLGGTPSGGCVNNSGPGPNSAFFYNNCYNAYAFPDNDGAQGYSPADNVDFTCSTSTTTTLTLCPGTTSDIPLP